VEGALAVKQPHVPTCKRSTFEKGQAIVLFALLLPVMALFLVGILDYMVTNARVMEVVAAADLAAHAGAQEIMVRPDGTLAGLAEGQVVAEQYFRAQAPAGAQFLGASCGGARGQSTCQVWAQTVSAGYLIPRRQIQVSAIGYLAQGVTRGDQ
jgi:Flp pilus assembly protein TadG